MSENQNLQIIVKEKIRTQWKTISKAFRDLAGKEQDFEGISKSELQFYLDHWGLKMNQKQFEQIYNMLDLDCDGRISFQDFSKVMGPEIYPGEELYFR